MSTNQTRSPLTDSFSEARGAATEYMRPYRPSPHSCQALGSSTASAGGAMPAHSACTRLLRAIARAQLSCPCAGSGMPGGICSRSQYSSSAICPGVSWSARSRQVVALSSWVVFVAMATSLSAVGGRTVETATYRTGRLLRLGCCSVTESTTSPSAMPSRFAAGAATWPRSRPRRRTRHQRPTSRGG
jgi:hypothetical protein